MSKMPDAAVMHKDQNSVFPEPEKKGRADYNDYSFARPSDLLYCGMYPPIPPNLNVMCRLPRQPSEVPAR
jgi:hypothetical protein